MSVNTGTSSVEIVHSARMASEPGLVHGFSTRLGGVSRVYRPHLPQGEGDLNLGFTSDDDPENVRENRRRFLAALPATMRRYALLRQIHSPHLRIIQTAADAADDFTAPAEQEGDGLLTDVPGVLLGVGAADCIPVLLYDPVQRAVGAFHAGWRGTLAGIVQNGAAAMHSHYGSNPADILAAIGPGIGPASYSVSKDVMQQFQTNFAYASELFRAWTETSQLHLDLWSANRLQLLNAGIPADNIDVLGLDTAADTARFFSHRAENGFTGRMLGVIGLAG